MAKKAAERNKTGSKSGQAVVKKKTAIKNRKAITILIVSLMSLILIATGFSTEAAQTSSEGALIKVSQEGFALRATTSRPERIAAWRVGRVAEAVCNQSSFEAASNFKEAYIFRLTADDEGFYYCFRAEDRNGNHIYQTSEQIAINELYSPPTLTIRQFEDVLLAEANDEEIYTWKSIRITGSTCSEQVFETAANNELTSSNILVLQPADLGRIYCFEATHPVGFKTYKAAVTVAAFDPAVTEETLVIEQFGNFLIARSSTNVKWQFASVADEEACSAQSFGLQTGLGVIRAATYVNLYADDNNRYYCFQAYNLQDVAPIYAISGVIEDVERPRPQSGYNSLTQRNYPYSVSDAYPTEADLRAVLRPLLTTEGQEILDGLEINLAAEIDCADNISGCYWVNLSQSGEGSRNKILIRAVGSDYYPDFNFYDRAQIKRYLLITLTRELMHAIDLGDGDLASATRLKYKADSCQDEVLEAVANRGDDEEVYGSLPISITELNSTDSAREDYLSCLRGEEDLFMLLRNTYDSLPATALVDDDRWLGWRLNTNTSRPWEINDNYALRDEPNWYADLYAHLVFQQELPDDLQAHYESYFSDHSTLVDIFALDL